MHRNSHTSNITSALQRANGLQACFKLPCTAAWTRLVLPLVLLCVLLVSALYTQLPWSLVRPSSPTPPPMHLQ